MRKMKKRNINLYLSYNKSVNVSLKSDKYKISYILCATGVLILLAGTYCMLRIQLKDVRSEYQKLSENLYSDEATDKARMISRFKNEESILDLISQRHKENISGIEISHELIDKMDDELINEILSCQKPEVSITQIMLEQNTLSVKCLALQADMVSGFVSELDGKKLFSDLSYGGFNVEGGKYSFTVTAVF